MSDTKLLNYQAEKILVVDDQLLSLKLLSLAFASQGYVVEQSDSGKVAIEAAKSDSFSVIILDICMPEMDGFEVCQRLKKDPDTQDIPIIFISATEEVASKIQAFNLGGNDYITKPFEIEELLARVKNQLNIQRSKTELKAKNADLEQELVGCQTVRNSLLKLTRKLGRLAILDSLTQIPNRYYFDEFFAREWSRAQREGSPLSLIFCDVDYFKMYNDYLGHQAGDSCLRQIANTISQLVRRPADLVARYGGEEFVIVLPQTPAENAFQIAEKIRLEVKKLNIYHPESLNSTTSLSLGVSCIIPSPAYTKQQLLLSADAALYEAKELGRDRTVLKPLDSSI